MLDQHATAQTVADLTPGTIVRVLQNPHHPRIPHGAAIIVNAYGTPDTADMVIGWFWGMGPIEPGRTAHALFPRETIRQTTDLLTLPEGAFQVIQDRLGEAYTDVLTDTLGPLTKAVEEAANLRDCAAHAAWRCTSCQARNTINAPTCRTCGTY
ncbi:hypothetical protein ACIQU6_30745 [Streptomyces sp. NPDC090442]|uniref:hypothetical protein n=1 Tax=Streptomyces sp. NPDC090442 TaxID=3365962 RepID=UPI00382ED4E7